MSRSLVPLVQPVAPNYQTGGYIYNAEVARYGAVDLQTIDDEAFSALAPASALMVDSLFFRIPVQRVPGLRKAQLLVLIHHLSRFEPPPISQQRWRCELAWLERSNGVVVTSNFMKQQVSAWVPCGRIEVVRPGVDPLFSSQRRVARRTGRFTILTVANVIRRKGYLEAARAIAAMRDTHGIDDFLWLIVGDDAMEPDYASRWRMALRDFGLETRTRFLGVLGAAAIAQQMAEADVFLLPSLFESFGMVFLEALTTGLPVVSHDAGEVPALVAEYGHGVLAPLGDISGLARGLTTIAEQAKTPSNPRVSRPPRAWSEVAAEFRRALQRLTVD